MDAEEFGIIALTGFIAIAVVFFISAVAFDKGCESGYNKGFLAGEDYILNTIGAKMIGNTSKFDGIILKDGTTVTLPRKLEQ